MMSVKYDNFKKGLETIFPEKEKEIIAAVVTVAYTDGTFNHCASLPDAEDDINIALVSDLIGYTATALMNCYLKVPSVKYDNFKKGLETIFPEKEKEIIGAVVTVAYTDGTYNHCASLPDAEDDVNIGLVSDLLGYTATALMNCYLEAPSALKKACNLIKKILKL